MKQIRKRHGWSQSRMAAALDVCKSTISLYEHDKRSPRDVRIFHALYPLANDEEKVLLRAFSKERRRRGKQ